MNYIYTVEYTLRDSEGRVIDTNEGREPFKFVSGRNEVIPGFEREVSSMAVGEEKTFTLPPGEAYGERREELIETLPRQYFQGVELQKGGVLYGQTPDGQTIMVTVLDFNDETVTIDHNHPLAGKALTFTVKLLNKEEFNG